MIHDDAFSYATLPNLAVRVLRLGVAWTGGMVRRGVYKLSWLGKGSFFGPVPAQINKL